MQKVRADRRLFKETQDKAKAMHRKAVREIADEVAAQVSGPLKAKDRRRLGHPYARRKFSKRGFERTGPRTHGIKGYRMSARLRHGQPTVAAAVPLLPINADTGRLRKSLRMRAAPPKDPSGQVLQLGFTAPYAKHVLNPKGTKRMVARGFQKWKAGVDRRKNRELTHELKRMILRAAVHGKV
jgi:hypothetical protein